MKLHIFVEGIDDENFFKRIVSEVCFSKYNTIKYVQYAEMPKEKVETEIQTVIENKIDFIFFKDFDFHAKNIQCVQDKINEVAKEWNLQGYKENIHIVINEIESWYLAGFDDKFCSGKSNINRTKIKNCEESVLITKEFFQQASDKSHRRLMAYLSDKQKHYAYELAMDRNQSFRKFFEKYCQTAI